MRSPGSDLLVLGGMLLTLMISVIPIDAAGGERHAGTVLSVTPDTRTLRIEELGANARRRELPVRLASRARVLRSERRLGATSLDEVFENTPIGLADVRPGDFVVVELDDLLAGVANLVIVTLRD